MIMARQDSGATPRSLYRRLNDALARRAGPAQVGPYESPDDRPTVSPLCPMCGGELAAHGVRHVDGRKVLTCP